MRNQQRKARSKPSLRHLVPKHSLAKRRKHEKNVRQPEQQGGKEWVSKMPPEFPPEHREDEIPTEVNDRGIDEHHEFNIRQRRQKREDCTRHQLRHKHRSDIPPQEHTDSNK